ncbi:MAG: hypothetical protein DRJ31_00910 [Candidatus Methanomethylicota archaeon]|uniref:CBS domain-containing protein n=1 Tax=Thermoproteota archaeon TaxID=2056631 RepID=A0A497EUW9_9CREN|nr:MAG: hypothetical protein DRJ31_00910 [Candidatus Verstraetearchaeota archaeon]RLE52858.1 MAG: hypothetical protein DRJ33_02615 [Candidatus Verstraetearchaeota archaeon]
MELNADRAFKWGKFIALSILIGLVTGVAVVLFLLLHNSIWFFTYRAIVEGAKPLIFIFPVTGIFVAFVLVRSLATTKTTGCGTHAVIESFHFYGGVIPFRDTSSKVVASALTIGFGGSAGLEGPSILLGGGLASAIAQRARLSPEELKALMLAGAAAGLSAIFKAPLTGILFALEIPYKRDLAKEAFIPAAIASVTSYLTLISLIGAETLFPIIPSLFVPSPIEIAHLIFIGLLASATSLFFIFTFRLMERFKVLIYNKFVLALLGGSLVGIMGLLLPYVMGAGYETISSAVQGKLHVLPIYVLVAILIFKILATSVTLNFGGSGGLFIPSIFIGAVLGSTYVAAFNPGFDEIAIMASMAAVLAAANKTLLTSVAFVAETCGPASIIPALIASTVSFFTSGESSLYEPQLPRKVVEEGKALCEMYRLMLKGKALERLKKIKIREVMTPNPVALNIKMSIEEALNVVKQHGFRIYPVVDDKKSLLGVVTLEDLLSVPPSKWTMPLDQTDIKPPLKALADQDLLSAITKMVEYCEDHVYVISSEETNELIGVLAGIDVFKKILESIR